jgi:hypothetical protein
MEETIEIVTQREEGEQPGLFVTVLVQGLVVKGIPVGVFP